MLNDYDILRAIKKLKVKEIQELATRMRKLWELDVHRFHSGEFTQLFITDQTLTVIHGLMSKCLVHFGGKFNIDECWCDKLCEVCHLHRSEHLPLGKLALSLQENITDEPVLKDCAAFTTFK